MAKPIDFMAYVTRRDTESHTPECESRGKEGDVPSNAVYARVGDTVLHTAQDGVRRGLIPEDIIREIATTHHVRVTRGELRLLLASRRLPADAAAHPLDVDGDEALPEGVTSLAHWEARGRGTE